MEIQGAGGVQGPDPVRPNRISASPNANSVDGPRSSDRAEISEVAKLKALLKKVPDVRLEKIERIRREIAEGSYETPEKFQVMLDRLLEDIS